MRYYGEYDECETLEPRRVEQKPIAVKSENGNAIRRIMERAADINERERADKIAMRDYLYVPN